MAQPKDDKIQSNNNTSEMWCTIEASSISIPTNKLPQNSEYFKNSASEAWGRRTLGFKRLSPIAPGFQRGYEILERRMEECQMTKNWRWARRSRRRNERMGEGGSEEVQLDKKAIGQPKVGKNGRFNLTKPVHDCTLGWVEWPSREWAAKNSDNVRTWTRGRFRFGHICKCEIGKITNCPRVLQDYICRPIHFDLMGIPLHETI